MKHLTTSRRWLLSGLGGTGVIAALGLVAAAQLPALGAGALLHPARNSSSRPAPDGCEDAAFHGAGVILAGWRCSPAGESRGTIVYLHGVADNRASAAGLVSRYRARGLDIVAYDSRAHGSSGGSVCTYGFFEKQDLRRVLDSIERTPVVLIGTSFGAAVALQAAAEDARISGVVAAEVFSDLRTIAMDRTPAVLPRSMVDRALALAGRQGGFSIDAVSPAVAARRIQVPVLLIHGANDVDTRPDHSRRVFEALRGPKDLLIVNGARHNESLTDPRVWQQIDDWLLRTMGQER